MNKEERSVLIDFVLRTAEQSTQDIIQPLVNAGISAVVFDGDDTALEAAINDSSLHGFAADVYAKDGAYLMLLGEERTTQNSTELSDWLETLSEFEGTALASHPYDRAQGRPWGDRIYRLKGVSAVATTTHEAASSRDQLAQTAAKKLGARGIGGSFGNGAALGHIATVIDADGNSRSDIIDALNAKETLVCRLESADSPCTPVEEPARSQRSSRDSRDNQRGGRRDSGRQRRGPRRR